MKRQHINQKGFTVLEIVLVLLIIAILASTAIYFLHAHKNKTTSMQTSTLANTHTPQEATSSVQKIYDTYLSASNNAAADNTNTQPAGIVGLNAVKGNLTDDFYKQAAASHNGSSFSCAAQFQPEAYKASLESNDSTHALVGLAIPTGDGSTTITGMTATVDLASLKITSVHCPN